MKKFRFEFELNQEARHTISIEKSVTFIQVRSFRERYTSYLSYTCTIVDINLLTKYRS